MKRSLKLELKVNLISNYFLLFLILAAPQQPAQNNATNAQKPPTNVADVPIPEEFIFDEDEQNKGTK